MNIDVAWPVKNLSNKVLILIPLVIAAIFGSAIVYNWNTTGDPVPLSMDFSGGSFVRVRNIQTPEDVSEFRSAFKDELNLTTNPEIRTIENGIDVETSNNLLQQGENEASEKTIEQIVRTRLGDENPEVSIESMGSIITELYKNQARNAAIAAIIAMAIILFISLRSLPVVGGILSVIALDFLGIIGGMVILNIPLSLASMAGILLIFGYAVNTNILLSTSVLKRKGGDARDRAGRAMSTGVKMSSTSATAILALNLITTAPELEQISAVLVIGILVDMLDTWFLNSGLIMRHEKGTREEYNARI